jgi:hypothetical protein
MSDRQPCHDPSLIIGRPGAITPAWLAATTGRPWDQVHVKEIGSGRALLSTVYRVRDQEGRPVIVKLPTSDPIQQLTSVALDAYERECDFYRVGPPRWPRTPRCWFAAAADDGTRATMVLEDLGTVGRLDQVRGVAPRDLARISDALANAHASGPVPELDAAAWRLDDPRYLELLSVALLGGVIAMRQHFEEQWPSGVSRFVDQYLDRVPALLDDLAREEALLHGDLRADNVFSIRGEIVLVDFQMLSRGSPFFDLAYLAGQSADLSTRQHATIVERHRMALATRGRLIDPATATRHYQESLLVCLAYPLILAASVESMPARSRELVTLMFRRVVCAITRCEALGVSEAVGLRR